MFPSRLFLQGYQMSSPSLLLFHSVPYSTLLLGHKLVLIGTRNDDLNLLQITISSANLAVVTPLLSS